ncbi:sensor histidine kinase [Methanolobus bombayensis]|uniref:sensor histidine kinase n=1 Tax=Methanolobus bombayensis TaxID=38023 RepID=UPI001AE387C1|nr:ATP-binding protein [Methanolobus bombayensis]MBP1910450.1 PAS domain S-box-containing protein [Methanolobus bombayensis]
MSEFNKFFFDTRIIILLSLVFGSFYWFIDALIDYIFISGNSFTSYLLWNVSTHEIYMRFSVILIFLLFGIVISTFAGHSRTMSIAVEDEKKKSYKIMDILPMIVLFLDIKGNVSCVNKKILELTGYEEEQISGDKWLHLLFSDSSIYDIRSYWDQFLSGEIDSVTDLEVPIICADGSRKLILWNAVSFTDKHNEFSGILISGEDVTDVKNAEKALLLDESRLEALLKLNQLSGSTKEEILDFSLEKAVELTESEVGYVGFVNEAEEEFTMYGRSIKSEDGFKVTPVNIDFDIDENHLWSMVMKQRKPVISNNYPEDSPVNQGFPSGHVKVRNYLCIPISDSEEIVMIAGVGNKNGDYDSSDIRQMTLLMEGTWKLLQRRKDEEKIKSYARELEDNNKELESLDRMKDEFMANITHELKTPLIPIKGYSELLFEGHLGSMCDEQKKGVSVILQNAERLHKLIDSLLYMQNIRTGNMQYHLDSIDIVYVIDKVVDKIFSHKDGDIPELKKEYSSPLPFICGNTTYMEQVFSHILENAFKFTPPEGSVTIEVFREKKNIHVIVRDTGIGISEEEMPHIFKRFYQADGSLTRRHGGNGLGLYLCKSVVEAHGGSIRAVSELGNGTEIHVLLPVIE